MPTRRLGLIMNGVTGRMGLNQHLIRSIVAIRDQGGVALANGDRDDDGFREQWEMFVRHVCENAPYKYTLLEGAKGVQFAECALQSWNERRWIDVAPIKV